MFFGLGMLIPGVLMPTIADDMLTSTLEEELPVSSSDGNDEDYMNKDQPYDYYIYNVTNAKDVQNGSKPILDEVRVQFTKVEHKYGFETDGDTYSYRTYNTFTPLVASDWDKEFITINPVYAAAVVAQGASELGFQSGSTGPMAIDSIFGNLEAFMTAFQLKMLGSFLSGFLATVVGSLSYTDDELLSQWDNYTMHTDTIATELTQASVTGFEPSTGFTLDNFNLTKFLFDEDNEACGLLNSTGAAKWGLWFELSAYVAAGISTAAQTVEHTAVEGGLGTCLGGSGQLASLAEVPAVMGKLALWFTRFAASDGVENTIFFGAIKTALAPALDSATTWEEMGFLQYGASAISNATTATDTINPSGVPFEFAASTGGVVGGGTGLTLTIDQVKLFKKTFNSSNPLGISTFAGTMAAAIATGDSTTITGTIAATYGASGAIPLGVDASTAATWVTYLTEYVSEAVALPTLFGGAIQDDGTYPLNGGLFVRRNVREILHGYSDDPLLVATGQSWFGFEGPVKANEGIAQAIDIQTGQTAKKFIRKTGNGGMSAIGDYVAYKGVEVMTNATDIFAGVCPGAAWVAKDASYGQCKMWREPEVIKGTHSLQWQPRLDKEDAKDRRIYIDKVKRDVQFEYEGEVDVKGITLRRYRIDPATFEASADPATDKYHMVMDGFVDMAPTLGMVPIWLGSPRHYLNPTERAKISGTTSADWADGGEAELGLNLDVEPITGLVMNANQRLQINVHLERAAWGGFFGKTMYFGGAGSPSVNFPIYWVHEYDTIGDDKADTFKEDVYGNLELADNLQIGLSVVGVLLLLLGVGALIKGLMKPAKVAPSEESYSNAISPKKSTAEPAAKSTAEPEEKKLVIKTQSEFFDAQAKEL